MCKYKTVYSLLKNPDHWTRGVSARTKRHGRACEISEGSAFCLLGATEYVYGGGREGLEAVFIANARVEAVINRLYPTHSTIFDFNDNRKTRHADILRVLKEAGV
jgi:hypothetical protein